MYKDTTIIAIHKIYAKKKRQHIDIFCKFA